MRKNPYVWGCLDGVWRCLDGVWECLDGVLGCLADAWWLLNWKQKKILPHWVKIDQKMSQKLFSDPKMTKNRNLVFVGGFLDRIKKFKKQNMFLLGQYTPLKWNWIKILRLVLYHPPLSLSFSFCWSFHVSSSIWSDVWRQGHKQGARGLLAFRQCKIIPQGFWRARTWKFLRQKEMWQLWKYSQMP